MQPIHPPATPGIDDRSRLKATSGNGGGRALCRKAEHCAGCGITRRLRPRLRYGCLSGRVHDLRCADQRARGSQRRSARLAALYAAVHPLSHTVVLLASSVTIEIARRRVATFMTGGREAASHPARWLYITLILGLVFLAGQYVAWRQLYAQGLYLATFPSSSFFYVFTAAHALHLFGGLVGMARVIRKLKLHVLRRSTLDATVRYWHFMDVLWIYLLILLWAKL